ncbi:response regulator transcription factor [Sphingomonas sp. H39-1-10]|uniref:response regulator transcription factor n=1 Tax=Sphingomonas pollutisoli TaxID=3030829 RepID=UPI0023B96744|nr:response regulator transcription factor [Sphingomonas pollutisoli]MDF0487846.1 response regulator transcription factor [Sphingomonas pollutisoli]
MYRFPMHAFPEPACRATSVGRILVIDEDERGRDRILSYLRDRRWTSIGSGPRDVAHQLHSRQLSLVALSARLSSRNALDVLREIRSRSNVPVILYDDGAADSVSTIVGLELGADDVLSGALNLAELMARTRAVLRRQELGRVIGAPLRGGYRFSGWEMRHAERALVAPDGTAVDLTKSEYSLLAALLEAPGRSLSRVHLMRATRAHDDIFDRSVDVQVLRLRKKLARVPGGEGLIKTERGFGYRLEAEVEALF